MRELSIAPIIFGLVAFVVPVYRQHLPRISVSDFDLRLMGLSMLVLAVVTLWMTRSR